MRLLGIIIGIFWLNSMFIGTVQAEETLKVGIKLSEPWVMYDEKLPPEQRQPSGFSIDLWNAIAGELGTKTEWVYFDTMPNLILGAQNKQVDAGISAITVTSEREAQVDFSNSMYELGLQIMVSADSSPNPLMVAAKEISNLLTWKVLLVLTGLVLLFAHVRWLVDQPTQADEEATFAPSYRQGIPQAAWWALTMFITWDTPPRRGLARVVDLVWFLTGFLALGILSSVITAALTAQNITSSIQNVNDLAGKRVAAVATDAPRAYLEKLGLGGIPVENLAEGIKRVANKEVDALVHDGPRLTYLASEYNKTAQPSNAVMVLPASFNPQIYGIAFPSNSQWVEPVNQALLKLREAKGTNESVHEALRKRWLQE